MKNELSMHMYKKLIFQVSSDGKYSRNKEWRSSQSQWRKKSETIKFFKESIFFYAKKKSDIRETTYVASSRNDNRVSSLFFRNYSSVYDRVTCYLIFVRCFSLSPVLISNNKKYSNVNLLFNYYLDFFVGRHTSVLRHNFRFSFLRF